MKYLFFLFLPASLFAQPDPSEYYPIRLKQLNEQLIIDPFNYDLLWQRLQIQVLSLPSRSFQEVFVQGFEKVDCTIHDCAEIERDFAIILEEVLDKEDFSFLREADYILYRLMYYGATLQLDKAISDAYHLRDIPASTHDGDRYEYYCGWASDSLFRLYVLKGNYDMALMFINHILEEEKCSSAKLYYSYANRWYDKVKMYEHFRHTEEIVPYMKQLFIESFDQYFHEAGMWDSKYPDGCVHGEVCDEHTYYMENIRSMGFGYLLQLLYYMKQYDTSEYVKYEAIYNRMNDPWHAEWIRKDLNDKELREIMKNL